LNAFVSFDIDEIEAAMEEIEKFTYTDDDGLVSFLREKLDQGKYTSMKDKLMSLPD